MTTNFSTIAAADLPRLLMQAIADETASFLACDGKDETATDAALDKVNAIHRALLAVPPETVIADQWISGSMDHVLALALYQRRWLVMEGSYADPEHAGECRMVDLLLAETAFDAVPLLWHLNGETRAERPSAAEFEAARAMRDERKAA